MIRHHEEYPCPVCGYFTIETPQDWDICPICFWEDDVLPDRADASSPANRGMSIAEAQANYILHGAVDLSRKRHVRPPGPDDRRAPAWRPLPRALEIVANSEARRFGGS
jgi:hypothetical protein